MLPFILIKMLMNVDVGENCIHVFIGLFLVAIAYFAWRSTNIREQPHYHTVLLLERRLRRRTTRIRLSTHIETTSIVSDLQAEATSSTSNSNNQTSDNSQPSEANKPPVANTSSSGSETETDNSEIVPTENTVEERELETIVEIMDADAIEVRRRRLAYYENQQQDTASNCDESNNEPLADTTLTETVLESLETAADEPIMEHNYADREVIDTIEIEPNPDNNNKVNSDPPDAKSSDSIRIKLKYLNDELKLVDGRLEEQLGEFKRRHFHLEFSSNKLVRLIFNGQVLQPDSETLQSCGLFDNCVVHCLIHQQRNVSDVNDDSATSGTNTGLPHSNNNNNDQGRDWDLGNILFALVSLILTSAWYFRYEYAHLYNVTATIALVAITGIFTIFLVGVYFPDYEQPRVPRQ